MILKQGEHSQSSGHSRKHHHHDIRGVVNGADLGLQFGRLHNLSLQCFYRFFHKATYFIPHFYDTLMTGLLPLH